MAKKGQKFSKYSDEVVDEVLNDFFVKKYSAGYISEQRNIPEETIWTWVFKHQRPELFPGHEKKRGRPKKDDPDIEKMCMDASYIPIKDTNTHQMNTE